MALVGKPRAQREPIVRQERRLQRDSMEPITVVLALLIVQAALGAFDTVVSHEWRERLPAQPWAARELNLHALRSALFAVIFIGSAWFEWHGGWGWGWALRDAGAARRMRRRARGLPSG